MRDLKTIAHERQTINDAIRAFFRARGFVEVETPALVRSPGMEPNLSPFETALVEPDGTHHAAGLITSPEYALKKLLGQGMEKVFSIAKVFRNGEDFGGSPSGVALRASHNPEFTMLEWYAQGADYRVCMGETEELLRSAAQAFILAHGGNTPWGIDPFRRERVRDLLLERAGIDLDAANAAGLRAACERLDIHADAGDTESDLFYRLFLATVEPHLGKDPVFVHDYPRSQASLARLTPDGRYGERFELYVDGLEVCNGFTELVDPQEQRERFQEEAAERASAGKTVFPIDEEFLSLLPSVRKPTYGNSIGVDRLHMLLAGVRSIEDVILFPARRLFP